MKYSCQTFWPSAVWQEVSYHVSTHTLGEGVSWVENLELRATTHTPLGEKSVTVRHGVGFCLQTTAACNIVHNYSARIAANIDALTYV